MVRSQQAAAGAIAELWGYLLIAEALLCRTATPADGTVGFGYGTTTDGLHWTTNPPAKVNLTGLEGSMLEVVASKCRHCRSAALPAPFSRCFNSAGEGASQQNNSTGMSYG